MSASTDRSPPWEEGRASVRIRFSSSAPSGTAAERLTDDLIVEILSRVPAKSLCRFKCVSNHWLSLIHHPDHRKKLPQTLAGFFYISDDVERIPMSAYHLVNFSGRSCPPIDKSFSFLRNHRRVRGTVSLGFDLAVSSHFHVFVLLPFMDHDGDLGRGLTRVDIFSSETGRWVRKEKRWNENLYFLGPRHQSTVFLNGYMHFYAYSITSSHCVVAVDMEGETWTTFRIPGHLRHGFLQLSQGYLHYSSFQKDEDDQLVRLVVYVLEDYDNKEWKLKHSIETSHISGWTPTDHRCIAIHPECDLIFFTAGVATKIMCYNMNSRHVKLISNVEYDNPPYLLYVPLYAELQSLHT